ncbi:MAG TPA: hypothetical protein VJ508_04880 [Saprospiraceae bacterium]|nr:hypothetical protein [Saprospiraceae bacterium]
MKLKQHPLTAEDEKFIVNQLAAALTIVTGLRTYLEQTGKLKSIELKQFKTAEGALHAIRIKPSPSHLASRASTLIKRVSPSGQK